MSAKAAGERVVLLDEEPNGLASMLAELIRQNLERDPSRQASLERAGTYAITAHDIGLSVRLATGDGRLEVSNGKGTPPALVRIRADAATLLEFSSVPLRLGQPDLMTRAGREAMRKVLGGRMKVAGLIRHLGMVGRLNRLLSAN